MQAHETRVYGNERDYPYDPKANIRKLDGLDRLRAISDRRAAQCMYDIYDDCIRNDTDPKRRAEIEANDRRIERERREKLIAFAKRAHEGEFGGGAKNLVAQLLPNGRNSSTEELMELQRAIRRLGQDGY